MDHDIPEIDTSALHDPTIRLTSSERGSLLAIEATQRELARMDAVDEDTRLEPRRERYRSAPSPVFSLRLDRDELAALETRAAEIGIKPSVLARNLIRVGLSAHEGEEVARVVDQLAGVVSELRCLVR